MYRSILTLNTQSPSARRDLCWPYEFYRTIERCKANSGVEPGVRVLFCYDGENRIVVQSSEKLHFWDSVPRDYVESIDTQKVVFPTKGDILEFQLSANPIIKKSRSRFRVTVHGTMNHLAWLALQGAKKGFGIIQADVVEKKWTGRNGETADKAELPAFRVTFQGVLVVTDEAQFAEAVELGIGAGKMHGLGLLRYNHYTN